MSFDLTLKLPVRNVVHWQTRLLFILIDTNWIFTLKVSYSEFHSGIVWYHSLLRQYHFLPDTSNLLRATERIVPAISMVKNNIFTITLFSQRAKNAKKVFGYLKSQFPYSYNETNNITKTPVSCFSENMFDFDVYSLYGNLTHNSAQTAVTTAPSRNWKRRPTAIRVSVSTIYVTFFMWCCNQTEG
jgi:hypothetical protein